MSVLEVVAVLVAATVCGLLAEQLHVPGGAILGALVGSSAVTLATGSTVVIPSGLSTAAFIVIGALIGVQLTRQAVTQLGPVLLPAVIAAVLIILAGVAITYLLRLLHMAPPGDVLATSPGALSVMSSIAVEQNTGLVEVAMFHLTRIVLVILSLPLLIHLLPER